MKQFFALLLLPALVLATAFAQNNVGINTTPDNSAALHVQSTTQGMLVPRMTQSDRDLIATPATGLLVYQTDGAAGFYFYNGSAWTSLSGGGTTDASALTSGTLPDARLSSNVTTQGNTFNGANQLVKANASGLVNTADLGTGTANSSTYLRGDGTWATPSGGGALTFPIRVVSLPTTTATATITVVSGDLGGYILMDMQAASSGTITVQVDLPDPATAGNGARVALGYLRYNSASYEVYAKTSAGSLLAGSGIVSFGNYLLCGTTSEFVCNGTNWYEVPGL